MKKLVIIGLISILCLAGCEKKGSVTTGVTATTAPTNTPTATPSAIPVTPSKTGAFGITAVTPRTVLEARSFEIDCKGNIGQQLKDIGFLYKGDTVVFKPEEINVSVNDNVICAYVGAACNDCEELVSKGIATVEYSTYGTPTGSNGNANFGSKITITSNYAVLLSSNGGGGSSSSQYTKADGQKGIIAYYACSLKSYMVDESRELVLKAGRTYGGDSTDEINISDLYCYDENNIPERMYVVDDNIEFKLGTPVCEGMHFSYWKVAYPSAQRLYCDKHDDGTFWIHTVSSVNYAGKNEIADEGKPLTLEACFRDGNTVTFNAEGGALDGFDKKIIEIFDSSWLNEFDVSTFVPERIGYTFTGWYAEKECSGEPLTTLVSLRNPETHALDTKLQLYAGWKTIQ